MQVSQAPASSLHLNEEPLSVEAKPKLAEVSVIVPVGPEETEPSGGRESTVKVRVAGVGSALPAWSTARTSKVCSPSASGAVVWGDSQLANSSASTRHSKPAPDSLEKVKAGVGSAVGLGGSEVIAVLGGRLFTVKGTTRAPESLVESGSSASALTKSLWGPFLSRVVSMAIDPSNGPG